LGAFFIHHLNAPKLTYMQGSNLGKGGIDTMPSDDRAPPVAPAHLLGTGTADSTRVAPESHLAAETSVLASPQLLPRESGKDIGMGSPVPLSAEAVGVITRLRNMKVGTDD
jgi:tRNA pseudouridine synthase 9